MIAAVKRRSGYEIVAPNIGGATLTAGSKVPRSEIDAAAVLRCRAGYLGAGADKIAGDARTGSPDAFGSANSSL